MKLLFAAFAFCAISGCGTVKVTSEKVPVSELHSYVATPGIYYALPKTQLQVTVPLTIDHQTKGFRGNVLDACQSACKEEPDASKPAECVIPAENDKITLGKPELALKSLPDFDHLYRLKVDGGWINGVTHTVDVAENGVLTDSKTVVVNQAPELALSVLSAVAKTAPLFASALRSKKAPTSGMSCRDARVIATRVDQTKRAIEHLERERDQLLLPRAGVRAGLDAERAKLADKRLKELIQAERDKLENYRADNDLTEERKTYKATLVSKPVVPGENTAVAGEQLQLAEALNTDDSVLLPAGIAARIKKLSFLIDVQPDLPVGASLATLPSDPNAAEPTAAGYRYRIPVQGLLTLKCKGSADLVSPCGDPPTQLLQQQVPIAQYGALATLPAEFKGKGASVEMQIHPATAGLKMVGIGNTPVPASAVSDSFGAFTDALAAAKKRRDDEAQAQLDAEKNDLTREKDVLQLKKDIRDLKKDLAE
jgi:hypothetical protein